MDNLNKLTPSYFLLVYTFLLIASSGCLGLLLVGGACVLLLSPTCVLAILST